MVFIVANGCGFVEMINNYEMVDLYKEFME